MTPQAIFNKVAKHLLKQNAKSLSRGKNEDEYGNPGCAYRGNKGMQCAFGCLITDKEYKPWMENVVSAGVLADSRCPDTLKRKVKGSEDLVRNLQNVHDTYGVEEWPLQLKRLATQFKLSDGVLSNAKS